MNNPPYTRFDNSSPGDRVRVGAGVDGDLENRDKRTPPGRVASCAGLGRASGPGLVTKLGGVVPQKPAERLGVLERQHRRHPAAQVLLEIGLVPADGDGYAGQG